MTMPTAVLGPMEGAFTKVVRVDDSVRWRATISDDGVDAYATRMTTDLHEDFIRNADRIGQPYLTVAHFNQFARIGRADRIWRDGRKLKAEGTFFLEDEDPLIRDLSRTVAEKALAEQNMLPRQRTIKTSIGFTPSKADQENLGVIAYNAGVLPEIAVTSMPGNSRADFEATETRALSPDLMERDATNIVGEDLAKQLRERLNKVVGRAAEDDVLTILYRAATLDIRASVPTHKGRSEETTSWDGDAATERARTYAETDGDVDFAKYREFFAVYDADAPDNLTSYGFIHHDVDDNGPFVSLAGVVAAGNAASGGRSGEVDTEAQTHLTPHYEQFDRTAPWNRERSNLAHRLEEIDDLRQIDASDEEIDQARSALAADLWGGEIANPVDGSVTVEVRSGSVAMTLRNLPPIDVPLTRVGRKLQGKKLSELEAGLESISSGVDAVKAVLAWAAESDGNDSEERSVTLRQRFAPDLGAGANLTDASLARYMEIEPDSSIEETVDYHKIVDYVFTLTYTLSDIVMANLDPDEGITAEQRMDNIGAAVQEYQSLINAVVMGMFGQGRSTADNKDEMTQQPRSDVNGDGGGPQAPVNAAPASSNGKPDLSAFDAKAAELRSLMEKGASAEQLQAKLYELADPIREAVAGDPGGGEPSGDLDAVLERVAGSEVEIAGLRNLLEQVNEKLDRSSGDSAAGPSLAPRRRAFDRPPPSRQQQPASKPTQQRTGFTIREVVDRTTK